MDIINLLVLVSFTINLFLALVVHFRSNRTQANKFFEFTIYAICGWCLAMIFYRASGPTTQVLWARLLYFFPTFIPVGFLLFGTLFPYETAISKWKATILIGLNLAIATLSLVPGAIISSVSSPPASEKIIDFGWAYPLYLIYIPTLFIISYYTLFRKYKSASPLLKAQVLYILLGLTVAANPAMITNLLLPTLGYFKLNWLGQIFLFPWVASVTYAIVRHRLMDIRLIVVRTTTYTLLVTIFAAFYGVGLFLIGSILLETQTPRDELYVSIFLALVMAFSFQPLRRLLEKTTNNIFYKDRYDPTDLLAKLSHIMASTLSLSDLSSRIIRELHSQMKVSRGYLALSKDSSIIWASEPENVKHINLTKSQIDYLLKSSYSQKDGLLVFEELPESRPKKIMRDHNLSIALPLVTRKKEIGALLLGEKSSGDFYSSEDIEVLKILAPEMAVAVRNAFSYEEIKRFNITLKDEVKKATKSLRAANKKLKELDKLKDEFVSIASHELRTPMTAIKGYLWLVLNKDKKIPANTKKHLDRAYESTERLITLVNDMLNVSRIEGGRIELNPVKFDLSQLIAEVKEEIGSKAEEKAILLSTEAAKPCNVKADKDKIHQVLMNLVGNAIKFTPEKGNVKISISKTTNSFVQVDIVDTGIGIRKEDMDKLFTKFGRLESAKGTSGTGLGLYISKNIIELSGGTISVESEPGKGSTFSFTLPAV